MRTYGSVQYSSRTREWLVQCEPNVSMRLKRVFGKLPKSSVGVHAISDTPENARDLEWFIQRYPLNVAGADILAARADEHRRQLEMVDKMFEAGYQPPEFKLALPAREYQRVAAAMVLSRGGLLLADDVGLGKTASAICTFTDPRTLPALVVTLAHLPKQWQAELRRFLPTVRTHVVKKGRPYYIKGFPEVILINYHKLAGWAEHLAGNVQSVVFDEAQELRKTESAKYAAAAHIARSCQFRMGLSVGPDSAIELTGGPFGSGWVGGIESAWRIAMGTFSESITLPSGHECLIVHGVSARGWSDSGFCWKPVRTFIRHKCDRRSLALRVSGQDLVLTDDHSVFRVLPDGDLDCPPAANLSSGDIVPTDTGDRWQASEEPIVDVATAIPSLSKAQVVVDLSSVTRQQLGLTAWQWQNCRREAKYGTRLPLDVFLRHRHILPEPSLVYFGRCRGESRVAPFIKVSDWAYVLGFFLGDGWLSPCGRIAFAVEEARADEFSSRLRSLPGVSLDPKVRKMPGRSVEIRASNRLFSELLLAQFGGSHKCHEKSIPAEWIMTWPKTARLELLRGLVDSDGNVSTRSGRLSYCTTSRNLVVSLLSLLRSVGVIGSVLLRKPADGGVINGRRVKAGLPSYVVNWSHFAMNGDNSGRRGLRKTSSDNRYNESRLRSIRDVDAPEFVYDLEMDGHPSFVANGLLVHNSATPIYNFGNEMWAVMNVLFPGDLGTKLEFGTEWCGGQTGDKSKILTPKAFGRHIRDSGMMLRRTRSDVGRELPAFQAIPHFVESDPDHLNSVKGSCVELAKLILSEGVTEKGAKMHAAEELSNRLRQATGIAKAPYVAEFVRLLIESGERVVLYGWHRAVYDIWGSCLEEFKPAFYTGHESPAQKEESKRRFIAGETPLMIISLRAGAGLDGLQHASRTVVFGELDWSPGVHEQCAGRVYRDGQKDPVTAYYLLAEDGADPIMSEVLGLKKQQIEGIRRLNDEQLIERLQADGQHIKRLAQALLAKKL